MNDEDDDLFTIGAAVLGICLILAGAGFFLRRCLYSVPCHGSACAGASP